MTVLPSYSRGGQRDERTANELQIRAYSVDPARGDRSIRFNREDGRLGGVVLVRIGLVGVGRGVVGEGARRS